MLASLPMYDFPEVQAHTDQWWQILQSAFEQHGFTNLPDRLDRTQTNKALWESENLFITQTCGYPLRFAYRNFLRPVATPIYRAPGCTPGNYASAVVVRENSHVEHFGDLADQTLAANSPDSQSGYNAIRDLVINENHHSAFFKKVVWSGAHRKSLAAVRNKSADVAAIDPVSLALVRKHAPSDFSGLKILQFTQSVRGLPYAVPLNTTDETVTRIRGALHEAFENSNAREATEGLLIEGFIDVDSVDYDSIVDMQDRADQHPNLPISLS